MIAVAGGKGGSGKTTTTLGLARALARRDGSGRVVAADADWDLPNLEALALATNSNPDSLRSRDPRNRVPTETGSRPVHPERGPTVVEAVRGSPPPSGDGPSTPSVLAAPDNPDGHDAYEIFSSLAGAFSSETVILVDCPAGASPDAAAPLRAAAGAILVTPLRPAALRDTAKTAAMARALDCPPIGVVVSRAASTPDRLADLLGCPVLGTIPPAPSTPLSTGEVQSAYDGIARTLGASATREFAVSTDPNVLG